MMVEVSSLVKAVDTGEAGGHQLPNTLLFSGAKNLFSTLNWKTQNVY